MGHIYETAVVAFEFSYPIDWTVFLNIDVSPLGTCNYINDVWITFSLVTYEYKIKF